MPQPLKGRVMRCHGCPMLCELRRCSRDGVSCKYPAGRVMRPPRLTTQREKQFFAMTAASISPVDRLGEQEPIMAEHTPFDLTAGL